MGRVDVAHALKQRGTQAAVAGVLVVTLVAVIDLLLGPDTVVTALVLAGPCLAATAAGPLATALVGGYAIITAAALAPYDDAWGSRFVLRMLVIGIVAVAAVWQSALRSRGEHQSARSEERAADAQRLRLALDAGSMGTFTYDIASGTVVWDTQLESLFGLEPHTFPGTFDAYRELLHPDDRDRVLTLVQEALAAGHSWHFDHRVQWADGSVHWVEGRGEPLFDAAGNVVAATGVTLGIDARVRAQDERTALLEAEREARTASEESRTALQRLADVTVALSAALSIDDVAEVIVRRGCDALRADSGYMATAEEGSGVLLLRAQAGYPESIIEPYRTVPLDAALPATDALRSGVPIFIESPDDRSTRYSQYPPDDAHAAFVVVPIGDVRGRRAVLAFGFRRPRAFTDSERRYIAAVVEACAQALQRAALYQDEQESRARLRTLVDASEMLATMNDPLVMTESVARIAATRIGQFAVLHLMNDRGELETAAIAHTETKFEPVLKRLLDARPGNMQLSRKAVDTLRAQLIRGVPEYVSDVFDNDVDLRREGARLGFVSGVAAPLIVAGRAVGVLFVGDDRPLALGPNDVEFVADLARRAGSAIARANLVRLEQARSEAALRESQERLEAEHRMVEILQQTILPGRLPSVAGAAFAAEYRPADVTVEVGGDWYDVFPTDDGRIMLVVGDVAGHGLRAATLMGRARNGLRAYAIEDADPASVLTRLDAMLRTVDDEAMITAIVAAYDPESRVLTWARAGHPPPLLTTAEQTDFLEQAAGTPLGTLRCEYMNASVNIPPGALVVLYTDGVIERRGTHIDDGLEWLAKSAHRLVGDDLESICHVLVEGADQGRLSEDDMCVLVLRTS